MREGEIEFQASKGEISKKLDVFYNPDKKTDRDVNVDLLKILKPKTGLDLLAASGVRGLRLAKECGMQVVFNDLNPAACRLIKKNAEKNWLRVEVHNEEANKFLRDYKGKFDYVDVDPFGPPVKYLEGAIIKSRKLIGVTATDSSALCGSYPKACMRKYGSKPLKTKYCHELGLRILIKTCVEAGARYDIGLTPIFSYSRRDYFRAYFKVKRGAEACNKLLKQVGYWQHKGLERGVYKIGDGKKGEICGPLWLGKLWDEKLVKKLPDTPFFNLIKEECGINNVYYYLPEIFSRTGKNVKINELVEQLRKKGHKASRTHFDPQGIRTSAEPDEIIHLICQE